jgi:predicted kinase
VSGGTVIDPDAFLETEGGRVWTPERNAEAWRAAFATLRGALAAGSVRRVVVVCGLQGAGKSTWIACQEPDPGTVYVDAALPGARHRAPILALARAFSVPAEAVWIRTPLPVALERNLRRPADRQVPEASIRSVARLFEPPTVAEGFTAIRVIAP